MKNSNDNIGNRTRDLPARIAVPHPTAPPRASIYIYMVFNLKVDRILNMSNLFTKIYNMLYYTTNLYLQ